MKYLGRSIFREPSTHQATRLPRHLAIIRKGPNV